MTAEKQQIFFLASIKPVDVNNIISLFVEGMC